MNILSLDREVHLDDVRPAADRMHVVIYGPGSGEAEVVILPGGQVGVVDGCREPGKDGQNCPVHRLLASMRGAGVLDRLEFAALTHLHEDHFRGFASVLDKFRPHHLWWSGDEEARVVELMLRWWEKRELPSGPGVAPGKVRSIHAVRDAIEKAAENPALHRSQVFSDRKRMHEIGTGTTRVRIDGILPATADKRRVLRTIQRQVVEGTDPTANPNDLSSALLLRWGQTAVLLSGDCNASDAHPHCGLANMHLTLPKVALLKVPHHGSSHSFTSRMWGETRPDVSVVTPFGGDDPHQPPKPAELATIKATGTRLFTTRPKPIRSADGPAVKDGRPRPRGLGGEGVVRVTLADDGRVLEVALHYSAREL